MSGCSWLDGSPLCPDRDPLRLDSTPTGSTWYRRLGAEHLKRVAVAAWPALDWDWEALTGALDPSQDERLTWAAWQSMDAGGALWPLTQAWSQGDKPAIGAKEMPQWAYLRASMALAVERGAFGNDGQAIADGETGRQQRTQEAVRFYKAMSMAHLVPAAAVLREAGKLYPRWLDDGAWWIGDDYSGLQTALHESAIGTAWMGSRALDVGAVRSRGAPVRHGHRAAAGLPPLLDLMAAQMTIQGREGVDRPLTICIPAWHRDLPEILEKRQQEETRGVQLTILARSKVNNGPCSIHMHIRKRSRVTPDICARKHKLIHARSSIQTGTATWTRDACSEAAWHTWGGASCSLTSPPWRKLSVQVLGGVFTDATA